MDPIHALLPHLHKTVFSMLYSHLRFRLQSWFFLSGIATKLVDAFVFTPKAATCHFKDIILDLACKQNVKTNTNSVFSRYIIYFNYLPYRPVFVSSAASSRRTSKCSTFRGPCSIVIYSYNESQRDALYSQIYFWNRTLRVSDGFSVHHQESSTEHTQ